MSISYTWQITKLECYPQSEGQDDVVFQTYWTLTGALDGYTDSISGTVQLLYVAGTPYTPYDQLTEAQVITWTQNALGPDFVANTQLGIAQSIQAQSSPAPITPPLPWG